MCGGPLLGVCLVNVGCIFLRIRGFAYGVTVHGICFLVTFLYLLVMVCGPDPKVPPIWLFICVAEAGGLFQKVSYWISTAGISGLSFVAYLRLTLVHGYTWNPNIPLAMDVMSVLMFLVTFNHLLYQHERETREVFALQQRLLERERKNHEGFALQANQKESELQFQLQSGFSQLHHVLKNTLVSVQNVMMSGITISDEARRNLSLLCEDAISFIKARQIFVDVARNNYKSNPATLVLRDFFTRVANAQGVQCTALEKTDGEFRIEADLLKVLLIVSIFLA